MLLFIISLTFIYMNTAQKLIASGVVATTTLHQAFAQITFDNNKINNGLKGDTQTADQTIQVLITRFMAFLALIAVCYGLYGGFLMLTAGGDDKKVGDGKKILIHVGLGLIVIFLANSLVQFVLRSILSGS